jgi:hypothetical protein
MIPDPLTVAARCLTPDRRACGIRGRHARAVSLLGDLGGDGAGFGADLREADPSGHPRGTVRVPASRRDRHGCLQRDAGVLAAHSAAVEEPAAIWLALGYGYAWPAWLKVRREPTAIAGWPDHDASVALPDRQSRRNSRVGA